MPCRRTVLAAAAAGLAALAALAAPAAAADPPLVRFGAINWLSVYPDGDATGWGAPSAYAVDEINARDDLLPNTNISLMWSDPGRVPGATIVSAIDMFDPDDALPPAVAIIGCVHSNNAVALSNYMGAIKKPQLAWSATSAELSDKTVHPYFSRNQVGANSESAAFVSFFKAKGWRHAAVVHGNDNYGRGTADALTRIGHENDVSFSSFSVPWTIVTGAEEDARAALEGVMKTSHRLVILHLTRWMAYPVFAMARELGMLNGEYQFFLTSGSLALASRAEPPGWPVGTVVAAPVLPTREYEPFRLLQDGMAEWDSAQAGRGFDARALNAYDSVYVLARSVDEMLRAGQDIHNGTLLLERIRAQDFDGAMGRVKFDANGDGLVSLGFVAVTGADADTGLETTERFAVVDGLTLETTVQSDPVWQSGTTATPVDQPPDVTREIPGALVGAAYALSAVGAVVSAAMSALVHKYRAHAVIRASTPMFLQLILFGTLLAYGAVAVAASGPSVAGVCSAVPFLLSLAYVSVVGPLLVKTYRLHCIFNARRISVRRITTTQLFGAVGSMLAAELAIHGAWYGADRPEGELRPVSGTPFTNVWVCSMEQPAVWWSLVLVPKAALLLAGGVLAYKVRNLRSSFNESRSIAYSIYLIFFMSLFAIPLTVMSEEQPSMSFLVTAFGVIMGTLSLVGVLFGSKFWSILVTQAWREQTSEGATKTVATSLGDKPASGAAPSATGRVKRSGTPSRASGTRAAAAAPSATSKASAAPLASRPAVEMSSRAAVLGTPSLAVETTRLSPQPGNPSSAPGSPVPADNAV